MGKIAISTGLMDRILALKENTKDVFTLELLEDIFDVLELHKTDTYLAVFENYLLIYNENYRRISADQLKNLKMKMSSCLYEIQKNDMKFVSDETARSEIEFKNETDKLELVLIEQFDKIRKEHRYPQQKEGADTIKPLGEKDAQALANRLAKKSDEYKTQLKKVQDARADYIRADKLHWHMIGNMKIFMNSSKDLEIHIQNMIRAQNDKNQKIDKE